MPSGGYPSGIGVMSNYYTADSLKTITLYLTTYLNHEIKTNSFQGLQSGKILMSYDPSYAYTECAMDFEWGKIQSNPYIKSAVLKLNNARISSIQYPTYLKIGMLASAWTGSSTVFPSKENTIDYKTCKLNNTETDYDVSIDITDWARIWTSGSKNNYGIYMDYINGSPSGLYNEFKGNTGNPSLDAQIVITYVQPLIAPIPIKDLTKVPATIPQEYQDKTIVIGYKAMDTKKCISYTTDTMTVRYCPVFLPYLGDICESDPEYKLSGGTPIGGKYEASLNDSGDASWIKNFEYMMPKKSLPGLHGVTYYATINGKEYWDTNYINVKPAPKMPTFHNDSVYCNKSTNKIYTTFKDLGDTVYYLLNTSWILEDTANVYMDSTDQKIDVKIYSSAVMGHCKLDTSITMKIDKVKADFRTNYREIPIGGYLSYIDSSKYAISWYWSFFTDATSNSVEQNPIWYYNNKGAFDTRLIVTSKAGCKDTLVKTGYALVAMDLKDNKSLITSYPNPVTEGINVIGVDFGKIIDITDMNGKLMLSVKVQENPVNIPLQMLPAGTYLLNVKGEEKSFIKFIKQ